MAKRKRVTDRKRRTGIIGAIRADLVRQGFVQSSTEERARMAEYYAESERRMMQDARIIIGPIVGSDVERAYARKLLALAVKLADAGEWTAGSADAFFCVLRIAGGA